MGRRACDVALAAHHEKDSAITADKSTLPITPLRGWRRCLLVVNRATSYVATTAMIGVGN
ncbi:DUF4060 family protein [Salmonella enterica subsp. enterica]|nr:DUF4060 family protein [Salmonella enterica subsp. enterica]